MKEEKKEELKLNTNVDKKFLGENVEINEKISVNEDEGTYVYLVTYDKKKYIVKGYQIILKDMGPFGEKPKEGFELTLEKLQRIYHEFYYSNLIPNFNGHVAKALEIDHTIDYNERKISYLFIEILFEYGGNCLSFPSNIDEAYDLLRQSASALTSLNNAGIAHLDIKPENMAYDSNKKLLKLIDMGSSDSAGTRTVLYKPLVLDEKKNPVYSFTIEYSAPEIRQMYNNSFKNHAPIIYGALDSYCWGMTFYKLFLGRTRKQLIEEGKCYKDSGDEDAYKKFIDTGKADFDKKFKSQNKEESLKLKIIKEILFEALEYKPGQRIRMEGIAKKLIDFENINKIATNYQTIEQAFKKRMTEKLLLNKFFRPETIVINAPKKENDNTDCKDCISKDCIKGTFECKHTICKACITQAMLKSFSQGKNYSRTAFCYKCKKERKLSSFINNNR